jgi:hypothetical protein
MKPDSPDPHANVYSNAVTGATPNPVMHDPDDIDETFAIGINRILEKAKKSGLK